MITESRLVEAANTQLAAAVEDLSAGELMLSPAQVQLLEDVREGGRFMLKHYPREAFDAYLRVPRAAGSVQHFGLGVQTRVAVLRQHHSLARQQRKLFAAQPAVLQHKQLALLYNGHGMWCLTGEEIDAIGAAGERGALVSDLHLHSD